MKLAYCPTCTGALTKETETRYVCSNGHTYYNNARAACSVLLINNNRELLYSRRAKEPARGKYDFPGGFVDYGEDAYRAAVRELKEELAIDVDMTDLHLLDSSANIYEENVSTCDFVFVCRVWSGTIQAHDDVAAAEWKPIEHMLSGDFAWPYPNLYDKLRKLLESS